MMRPLSTYRAVAALVFLSLSLACGGTAGPRETEPTPSAVLLEQLADAVWENRVSNSPTLQMLDGLPVTALPDISFARAEADTEFARSILARLEDVEYSELNHDQVLTAEVIKWELGMQVEGQKWWWHFSVLPPYSSPLREINQVFMAYEFDDAEDLDRYLTLVHQYADFITNLREIARGQLERGIVTPRPNMQAVVGLVRSIAATPQESFLFVSDERLDRVATTLETTVSRFREDLEAAIETEVMPAVEGFLGYLETDYWRAAAPEVGVWRYPDGKEFYRYLVRLHTTMEVEPGEIFQLGLELIDELHAEMAAVRSATGFQGSLEDFHEILRTDPRFFPTTPEEVGRRLRSAADAMYALTDTLFLRVPEAPYDVRRLDPALEASLTYGYYDPPTAAEPVGYYNYNGARLDERSWLNLESVAYHELVPGHHFHFAFQLENEELNDLRSHSLHGAFTEGWGVYASNLGVEAGLFEDPYSRYGHCILESFLASRLVVDPGMNYMEWPLERARQFMRDYTVESGIQIDSETLRYSTDLPGQAVAYQMGRRKIDELRRKAEDALGAAFDIRRFHDALLGAGSLPMAVLEQHIDWFIEQER